MRNKIAVVFALALIVLIVLAVYVAPSDSYVQKVGGRDEFAGVKDTNLKPPLGESPRYDPVENPYSWVDPSTGNHYTTASWSYSVSIDIKGIASWNATIELQGRLKGDINWKTIDTKTFPNTTENNLDMHTLTLSDSGSEDINTHMGRFISNPSANKIYDLEYRIRWIWYGQGVKSRIIYNLTGFSDIIATSSAKNYVEPPVFSGTSVVEGSKYSTGSVTDGSTGTYVYDNTITSGDRARVQIQLTGCSGDWSSVAITVTLKAYRTSLTNAQSSSTVYIYADGTYLGYVAGGTSWVTRTLSGKDLSSQASDGSITLKFETQSITTTYKAAFLGIAEISVSQVSASWLPASFSIVALILIVVLLGAVFYRRVIE